MGLTCSRRLPPGWEKIQADFDEAVRSGDPAQVELLRSQLPKGGLGRGQDAGDANLLSNRSAEVQLKQALRSGDARLIEHACNEAETQGLEKAKLSLARAEAQRINAEAQLQEAIRSGDPQRMDLATKEAEKAGVHPSQISKGRSARAASVGGSGGSWCDAASLKEFLTTRATMYAAIAVLLYEWSAYNFVFLGRILPAVGKQLLVLPFLVLFNASWGLAVWSFIRCHTGDPGTVPQRWYEFVRRVGDALPVAPARLEWQPGKATMCKRCEVPRPERAHHCHVCGICVLRMDHHCPWINNCVGFNNHKFFLLLVAYCLLTSVTGLATACPELVYCMVALSNLARGDDWEDSDLRLSDVLVFIIFGFLALLFAGLLAPMAITHFELAAYNVTTIEGHYESSNMPNPFDQGTTKENFAQVFGTYGWDWFLPLKPARPLSDGIIFLRSGDYFNEPLTESHADGDLESTEDNLWRLRYQVRSVASERQSDRAPRTPSLSSWWYGSRDPSDDEAAGGGGGGRRPASTGKSKPRVTVDSAGRRVLSI